MWLPNTIVADVDKHAQVYYVDHTMTQRWNEHRHKDELRLLTGWCWVSRDGSDYRQGFKTITVAYRDAWYALVRKEAALVMRRQRLRVVGKAA